MVYRARQTKLRRLVAVKVLTSADASASAVQRFEQECAAMGTLSGHRNVVAVHDAGTTADGRPFLALHYDLWPAESQPPDPPTSGTDRTLSWEGGTVYTPDRDFPPDDISVDGHR